MYVLMFCGCGVSFIDLATVIQVTSLPLLLVQSLSKTGTFDDLLQPDETMDQLVKRGTVYILINALVGNMTRFALGPCMYISLINTLIRGVEPGYAIPYAIFLICYLCSSTNVHTDQLQFWTLRSHESPRTVDLASPFLR